MSRKLSDIIYQTLLYSDLFEYPLSKGEIWKYLLTSERVTKDDFERSLQNFPSSQVADETFFYLPKKKQNIKKRLQRKKYSDELYKKARKIASLLSLLPTINMIGISGSLAMDNCDKNSDIDLFFITKDSTLWITRLLVVVILHVWGLRKKRNERGREGEICTNMFLDETSLCMPPAKQNIYIAHEIVQVKPLINKNHIYDRFLQKNNWVKMYMANSLDGMSIFSFRPSKKPSMIVRVIESITRMLQIWYMRGHITTEIVGEHIAAFHPFNYEGLIINSFKKKQKKYV